MSLLGLRAKFFLSIFYNHNFFDNTIFLENQHRTSRPSKTYFQQTYTNSEIWKTSAVTSRIRLICSLLFRSPNFSYTMNYYKTIFYNLSQYFTIEKDIVVVMHHTASHKNKLLSTTFDRTTLFHHQ